MRRARGASARGGVRGIALDARHCCVNVATPLQDGDETVDRLWARRHVHPAGGITDSSSANLVVRAPVAAHAGPIGRRLPSLRLVTPSLMHPPGGTHPGSPRRLGRRRPPHRSLYPCPVSTSSVRSSLRIELPGPLDLPASLERFRRWGDDLLERWDGETYAWTMSAPGAGRATAIAARVAGSIDNPNVELAVEAGGDIDWAARELVARVVPRREAQRALAALAAGDPVVAELDARHPGVRPVQQRDVLIALVRSISAQQINLSWAATMRRRLAEAYGTRHVVDGIEVVSLDPARLAEADPLHLRELQFTNRKAASIVACARAVAAGELDLVALDVLADEQVIERLTVLPGIGRWSAEWFLARTLGRPRVVAGDLGVRKAVGAAYLPGLGRLPSEDEVRLATGHWGHAAGIAQQLLLHWLGEGRPPVAAAAE